MVVFFALILLSAAVLAWAGWVRRDILSRGEMNRDIEALGMAHSGISVAMHPMVNKQTPMLEERLPGTNLGYSVRIISEGGKLNIKWWLLGEDPAKIAVIKMWLEQRGLDYQQRETFIDSLLDFIDADDIHRLNGVEETADYIAPNRPLETVDEIAMVPGAEPLVSTPGWKDQLTVESSGRIDLLAAPEEILRLIPGFGESRIQMLLALRPGKDGIEGTMDDPVFQNLNALGGQLGLGQQQMQALNAFIMINDPVHRIISTGFSGKVSRQVEVVAKKGGSTPQFLSWKE